MSLLNSPGDSNAPTPRSSRYRPSFGPGYRQHWRAQAAERADVEEAKLAAAEPVKRTPLAQKQVRAEQAELYVQALGLKGACAAMGLGPWQVWSLRSWLAGGAVAHSRAGRFKPKLSPEARAEILAAKGQEKIAYLAALHGVHEATIKRVWAERGATS